MRYSGRTAAAVMILALTAGLLGGCGKTSYVISESSAATTEDSAAGTEEAGETSGNALTEEPEETAEGEDTRDETAESVTEGEETVGSGAEEAVPVEELEADVIVVGAGGAGMTAAVTARQAGKSVLVIEKTDTAGGNTALAGDAANETIAEALRAADNKTPGITVRYGTAAKHFIVEDGYVTGVECEGADGTKVLVSAHNGVVLATGGFARNVEMRNAYNSIDDRWPSAGEDVGATNTEASTGDGLFMAEEIGARLERMSDIQILPLGDPETGSLSGAIDRVPGSCMFINKKGNRFVSETADMEEISLALFEQPDRTMFMVTDGSVYPSGNEKNEFGETISELVEAGRIYRADTLEELAGQLGVSSDNLAAAVEEFNGEAEEQAPEGEASEGSDGGIHTPPYYAAPRVPTVHHTMGGVKINGSAQVIDTEGNVIPGLYAAGEVTAEYGGAWNGYGNTLVRTAVMGRIAGNNAAGYEQVRP